MIETGHPNRISVSDKAGSGSIVDKFYNMEPWQIAPVVGSATLYFPFDIGVSYFFKANTSNIPAHKAWDLIFKDPEIRRQSNYIISKISSNSEEWNTELSKWDRRPLGWVVNKIRPLDKGDKQQDWDSKLSYLLSNLGVPSESYIQSRITFFALGIGILQIRISTPNNITDNIISIRKAMHAEANDGSKHIGVLCENIVFPFSEEYCEMMNRQSVKIYNWKSNYNVISFDLPRSVNFKFLYSYSIYFTNSSPNVLNSKGTKGYKEIPYAPGNEQKVKVKIGWHDSLVIGNNLNALLRAENVFRSSIASWLALLETNEIATRFALDVSEYIAVKRSSAGLKRLEKRVAHIRLAYMDGVGAIFPVRWTTDDHDLNLMHEIHNKWKIYNRWWEITERRLSQLTLLGEQLREEADRKRAKTLTIFGVVIAAATLGSVFVDLYSFFTPTTDELHSFIPYPQLFLKFTKGWGGRNGWDGSAVWHSLFSMSLVLFVFLFALMNPLRKLTNLVTSIMTKIKRRISRIDFERIDNDI